MAQSLSYFDAPRNSIDKIIDKYFLKELKKKKKKKKCLCDKS